MATTIGWIEGMVLSLAIVSIFTIVVVNFNEIYDKENSLPFIDNSGLKDSLIKYKETSDTQLSGGEATFSQSEGFSLSTSWSLGYQLIQMCWNFLKGGWIEQVISSWNLGASGTILAFYLQIIWFISLVSAILYAIFKVVF
jgi:hypothetical protein